MNIPLTKNVIPSSLFNDKSLSLILGLYMQISHLKQIYRRGWLQRSIAPKYCESDADHCFGMIALAILMMSDCLTEAFRLKVIHMCFVHELGEVHGGDSTPADNIPRQEKYRRERESVEKVFVGHPNSQYFIDLWLEFEAGQTRAAKFVKLVDKLEMLLWSKVVSKQHLLPVDDFFVCCKNIFDDDWEFKKLFEEARAL